MVTEADVVGRVGERHRGTFAGQNSLHVLGLGRVADQEPMLADGPQLTCLGPRSPRRFLESSVQIEALRPFGLLPRLKAAEQVADLVLAEAGKGEVDLGARLQVREEAGEELLVPGA